MTEYIDRATAVSRLLGADNVLILSHKNPDGDTLGCAGALYWALTALDKTAAILCADPIPRLYSYLELCPFEGQFKPDFVVSVDVASIQLFGEGNGMENYSGRVDLCIDHHSTNAGFAYATLLDDHAAASAETLTELIPQMGVSLDARIADCLYTGIATDTNCFRTAACTARTHLMAARLMEAGARAEELNQILFETKSRNRIKIERMALESLRYEFDGRCAVVLLTKEQIAQSGVMPAEVESITGLAKSIEGVLVGCTLRQQPLGSYKISVRTAKGIDAASIVKGLGGGGHLRMAGCELDGMQENVYHALLASVGRALEAYDMAQAGEPEEGQ